MYNLMGQKHIFKIAVVSFMIKVTLLLYPTGQQLISLIYSDISNYQQMNPNKSLVLRLHMWTGAVKIFLENPIIGFGTGGYQSAMKKYENPNLEAIYRDFSEPHNIYLYMAANFGILGIISLFWFFCFA
jgi:Lipid A core - O-antigen ligase and related enzymes